MTATQQALVRMLFICRQAAEREDDTDTAQECTEVLELFVCADPAAEAKALVIIEAYVAVMDDQLKEQGL